MVFSPRVCLLNSHAGCAVNIIPFLGRNKVNADLFGPAGYLDDSHVANNADDPGWRCDAHANNLIQAIYFLFSLHYGGIAPE